MQRRVLAEEAEPPSTIDHFLEPPAPPCKITPSAAKPPFFVPIVKRPAARERFPISPRSHITGHAVPTCVVDCPGGGGKVLTPDSVVGRDGDDLLLANYEGGIYRYPDPGGTLGQD